jgi:hypothetical protein
MKGYHMEKRRARKEHTCKMGDGTIARGEEYWEMTIGGGGLGSIKFPDRVHLACGKAYLDRKESPRGNQVSGV